MSSNFLESFRPLDRSALAKDFGKATKSICLTANDLDTLGTTLEIAVLAQSSKPWSALAKSALPVDLAIPLRKAKKQPGVTFFETQETRKVGFYCLDKTAFPDQLSSIFSFQNVARQAMCFKRNSKTHKASVCGAIVEMIDNIFEHSGAIPSGIVGFLSTNEFLDICVADAGVGILKSLKQNPAYAYLADGGMALSLAIKDGASRFPTSQGGDGRGHGFRTLFQGLNSLDAEIRLRSDDYSLEVGGRGIVDKNPSISQQAQLRGFVVSFRIHY